MRKLAKVEKLQNEASTTEDLFELCLPDKERKFHMSLYWFSVTAVTIYHKLSLLKQQKFIISQFLRLEI